MAACMAAMIVVMSRSPGACGCGVLTFGPKLSVTFGLRLRTAWLEVTFFGWGVGEGSEHAPTRGRESANLPLGVAKGEGSCFASCGLALCFLGVVGSVLGVDPEIVRFFPLGVPVGGAWEGGGRAEGARRR